MKKLFGILLLSCGFLIANGQDKVKDQDVPQAVKTAFQSNFTDASDVQWKIYDGKYKAKFDVNGEKHFAEFTNSGELVAKGMKIDKDQLPSAVSDALRTGYANKNIDEVYKVEKGGETLYKVKLEGVNEKMLVYSEDGKLVKEKMKEKTK